MTVLKEHLPLWKQLHNNYTPQELARQRPLAWGAAVLGGITAFLMVLYFVVGWWLAGAKHYSQWDETTWIRFVIAVGLVGAVTIAQFIYYRSGVVNRWLTALKWGLVFFGIFMEGSQVMQNEGDKVRAMSQQSDVYQIAKQKAAAPATGINASPYSSMIQQAELRLARCQFKLGKGEERHCNGDAARVNGLYNLENQRIAMLEKESYRALQTMNDLEFNEEYHFEMIRLIKTVISYIADFPAELAFKLGSLLMSLVLIATFEGAYYFAATYLGAIERALKAYGLNPDGTPMDDEELPIKAKKSPSFGGSTDNVESSKNQGDTQDNHVPAHGKGAETRTAEGGEDDKQAEEEVYQLYLNAADLKTTAREEKPWFSRQFKELGIRKHIDEITKIRKAFAERAFKDGVFVENSEWDGVRNVPRYIRG